MREQIAQQPPVKRRASADRGQRNQRTSQYPASARHAGQIAGVQPDDYACPPSNQTQAQAEYREEEIIPDSYYPQPMQNSARRYYTAQGNQVIQQGNRRIVIHEEPPPTKKSHWFLFVGIGMLVMLGLWIGLSLFGTWWVDHQLESTYGYPRTYQIDEVVGHADSTDHPSHFIFQNFHGQIIIIEFPGGDYTRARIYKGPTLFSDNADQIPVTAEFKDVNGDGKIDIILHIQDQRIVFLNDGNQFKAQQ